MAVVIYKSINKTVADIAARDAITKRPNHMVAVVLDASADSNAGAGTATYRWNEETSAWILISKSTYETMSFDTEELLISSGQVTAANTPTDGQIWDVKVVDGDVIIADLRDEDLTISGNTISGLGSYEGYDLRFTYAYGSIAAAGGGADTSAIEARLEPIEEILEYYTNVVYDTTAAVYADGAKGVEDANLREGWYYTNDGTDLGTSGQNKINWYFHDGTANQVTLGDFSAYAVMTFDDASESPIFGIYTTPTGTNDEAFWYHSRVVYSGLSETPTVGTQYLVYFGQDPKIHPELPRLSLSKSTSSSVGDQGDSEIVYTASFGSNSIAPTGDVKFLVEHLGVYSTGFKSDFKLKINQTSQAEFNEFTSGSLGDMYYHDGTSFVKLPAGTQGQVLTMGASGVPEWA